ncbi:DUF3471 domain-containing protein [Roseivirga misakiensis]|uniref:Peptidase S12 Pab87-related C-terminal domain-containing protein n=1 Tax=Roseivirga misakiensis TaxID=1563681 RepID=A0A1E5T1Y1_9BACT|nr:DUF3471 domain-containing protein [Roseivirga misakiensis]OEK05380.1 hypothetical protein BFP71_18490 [Roseivirga misakiensis]
MKKVNNFSRITAMTLILALLGFSAFGQTTAAKAKEKTNDKALKAYVGAYEFDKNTDMGFDVTVWLEENGNLYAQPSNESQPPAQLIKVSEDKFELANTGGLMMSFERDKKKEVISLRISEADQFFTCIKKKDK